MKLSPENLEALRLYAEGNASAEQTALLDHTLRHNPGFRRYFLEYMNVDSALRDTMAALDTGSLPEVSKSQKTIPFPFAFLRGKTAALLAAAAALVVAFIVARQLLFPTSVEVQVLAANNAGPDWVSGQSRSLKNIALKEGNVRVRLPSGVELDLDGPLQARFDSPMHLRLVRGQVSADAGENGKGFTVSTDAGDVVDYGTRFGVDAREDGTARVAVFSGSVGLLERGNPGLLPVTLSEGDAVALRRSTKTKRLQSVRLSAQRSGFSPTPSSSGIVSEVSDNVASPDFNRFYGVVAAGMGEGAQAYTDKPGLRWLAMPGKPFPAELAGADTVRTFQATRHKENFQMQVRVERSANAYLLWDSQAPAPEWLQATFTPTNLQLQCGHWKNKRKPKPRATAAEFENRTFSVWKRPVVAGETLILGAMRRSDRVMYSLAFQPLE